MRILYIGDIMGRAGRETVAHVLPDLKEQQKVDFVVAQSENVSHGKSMLPKHMRELMDVGVDFFTGGNHSFERPQILEAIADPSRPVIGPANVTKEHPGPGWKVVDTKHGKVFVASILGTTFPGSIESTNPLKSIDEILERTKDEEFIARVINIHGDYSSEKVIFGHYLDGRADLVVGDHWHVPTADARVLPGGTGYISDVGMCGALNSSLGVEYDGLITLWRDGEKKKRVMAEEKPWQFNAVLFDTNKREIEYIRKIVND